MKRSTFFTVGSCLALFFGVICLQLPASPPMGQGAPGNYTGGKVPNVSQGPIPGTSTNLPFGASTNLPYGVGNTPYGG